MRGAAGDEHVRDREMLGNLLSTCQRIMKLQAAGGDAKVAQRNQARQGIIDRYGALGRHLAQAPRRIKGLDQQEEQEQEEEKQGAKEGDVADLVTRSLLDASAIDLLLTASRRRASATASVKLWSMWSITWTARSCTSEPSVRLAAEA